MIDSEYVNSLSVDDLRRNLKMAWELERLFVDAFKNWPAIPDARVLKEITGKFPEDWERGKRVQMRLPYGIIPAKCECEIGAGVWDRITQGAWEQVFQSDAKPTQNGSTGEGK